MVEKTRPYRWVAIAALVVGLVAMAFVGLAEECGEQAISVGSEIQTIQVCRDAPLLSPYYILPLIAIALLMWPDLSEFAAGPFSVKRRLEHAEKEQQQLRGDIANLTQKVNQEVSVVVPIYFNPVAAKRQLIESGQIVGRPVEEEDRRQSDAEATVDLLRSWERVSLFDSRNRQVPDSLDLLDRASASSRAREWVARVEQSWPEAAGIPAAALAEQAYVFSNNFPDMLQGTRSVRNSIAHGQIVARDDLQATLDIVRALESYLVDWFDHYRSMASAG